MLSQKQKEELLEEIRETPTIYADDPEAFTVEELVFLMNSAKKEEQVKHIREYAVAAIRATPTFYLAVSPTSHYPHMEKNAEICIFTETAKLYASKYMVELAKQKWKTSMELYQGTEDFFLYLYRIGVKTVSLNKGYDEGTQFAIEELHSEHHENMNGSQDIYTLNPVLHIECNEYMAELERGLSEDDINKKETAFLDVLSEVQLLFPVKRGKDIFSPESVTIESGEAQTILPVFSDETELLKCFPETDYVTFIGNLDDVLTLAGDTGFVLDPCGVGLWLDEDKVITYSNFVSAKTRSLIFLTETCHIPSEEAKRKLKRIMYHEDLWAEFVKSMNGSSMYSFDYASNPITIKGYTAERLARTVCRNALDAYVAMSDLRENPEGTSSLMHQGQYKIEE